MAQGLYFLIAAEVILAGGGRLLEIGPVTLRMVLFTLALSASCWLALHHLANTRPMRFGVGLVLLFLAVHLPPSMLGLVRGADVWAVFGDLQPILYWLIAPFFAFVLFALAAIRATATLVWVCSLILACGYLALLAVVALGAIDPLALYEALSATGEFHFREGGLFVYKSFLYLGIGIVFLMALRPKGYAAMSGLVGLALALTLTRGLLLATALAVVLLLVAQRRRGAAAAIVAGALGLAWMVWVYAPEMIEGLQGQREVSNVVRQDDMRFLADRTTAGSLFTGHGFGTELNERLNIEITYMWIFWKGGLPALLFWLLPLVVCWRAYRAIPRGSDHYALGAAFFFSVVLIYVQTGTNPYLNNPIGLSFVLIAMFALRRLAELSWPVGAGRLPAGAATA
jgi:hypothetical protein